MLKTLSVRNQNLPRRPKYGSGPSIKLRTNFFNVQLNSNTEIFRYVVSIGNLNDKQKGKRRRLIELLLEDPSFRAAQSSSPLATDFAGLLVTTARLRLAERTSEGRQFKEFRIRYKHEGQATAREDDAQYQVRIELAGSTSWKALMEYLNSPLSVTNFDKETTITAINTILRQHPISSSNVFSGAKSTKFYPLTGGEEANIDPGLIALKGYYASARTSIGRLLVNVNVCTSAFFRDGRVDLLMYLFPGPDFAEGFLKKRRISTDYLGSKRYRVIEGFARDPESKKFLSAHEATIHVSSSRYPSGKVSIADWFKDEHRQGKPLLKPNLPLILAGTSTIGDNISVPCWLPAEECRLVPGQPYGEKLTPQQTTKMLEFAALPPAENARRIVAEADRVLGLSRSNEFLGKFGLGIVNRMIIVEGRKLKGPNVVYQKTLPATNGSWNLRGAILKEKGNISNWTYLTVRMRMGKPEERRTASKKTMDNFRNVMRTHGLTIQDYTGPGGGVEVNLNDNWDDIDQRIENTLAMAKRNGIRVLLVILDREDTYAYSRIKFFADTKYGIHTVHAVATKMMTDKNPDSSPQYLANLALKFNLKLGGVNHTLPDDRLSFLQQGKTMVVGMDVVHPSPGPIKGGPSIVAVVASIDKDLAQWPASLRTQQRESKGATELVQEGLLEQMVIERLRLWQMKNGGSLPERILVYRDGVSESQYEQVVHTEIPTFYSAYAKLSKASVEVAFIVVGKRHHTRFFPTNIKETDLSYNQYRKGNPLPGTVVGEFDLIRSISDVLATN
ncbi:MAG: hypothetical protein Q9195_004256 [Heterodermia aff. obscurata]